MAGKVCSVDEFVQNTYDYIICGGATAGLVLAARLSEIPNVFVGVIEAGKDRLEDPYILTPLLFTTLLSNPEYDWMYQTAPQQGNAGRVHAMPRGKALGWSSATNFMAYVRGSTTDYDNWAELSSPRWSFSTLLPFFKKHERLEAPVTEENENIVSEEFHGLTEPLHTSFNNWGLPVEKDVIEAFARSRERMERLRMPGRAIISDSILLLARLTGRKEKVPEAMLETHTWPPFCFDPTSKSCARLPSPRSS